MKTQAFRLSLRVDVCLTAQQLWPDGDGPEHPTIADVRTLLEEEGGCLNALRKWDPLSTCLISWDQEFQITTVPS